MCHSGGGAFGKKIIGRYVESKKNEAVINSREKKLYKKGVMVLVYASEIYSICIAGILKKLTDLANYWEKGELCV